MGHVVLEYLGVHEVFSDVLLWMLRSFLLDEAKAQELRLGDQDTPQLRQFFEDWEWPGPGVLMGAQFETFVNGDERRRNVLLVHLHRTADRIAAFGEFIPVAYMNAHVDCGAPPWTRDFPTERLLKQIGRLCNLLCRQHLATN